MFMRGVLNQYTSGHALHNTGLVLEDAWADVASSASWLVTTHGSQLNFEKISFPRDIARAVEPFEAMSQDFMLERDTPAQCS